MTITSKVLFASALMLSAAAPTLSHAAYFVDQTKGWAINTPAENPMGTKARVDRPSRAPHLRPGSVLLAAEGTKGVGAGVMQVNGKKSCEIFVWGARIQLDGACATRPGR